MKCACSFTSVLALAGLAAVGFGGFNVMKTGCPLGNCMGHSAPDASTVAHVVPASATGADEGMPCCSKDAMTADAGGAKVLTVSDKASPDCAGMTDCGSAKDCPHMADCDGKGECPFKSAGAHPTCPATAQAAPTQVAEKPTPEAPKN